MELRILMRLCLVFLLVSSVHAQERRDPAEAEPIARYFIDYLAGADPAFAYELLGSEVRQELEPAQFSTMVKGFGDAFGKLLSVEVEEGPSLSDGCAAITFLSKFEHSHFRMKFRLCPEKESWRIGWFATERLSRDVQGIARALILTTLEQFEFPEPEIVECPAVEDKDAEQIVYCRAGYGHDCTLTFGLAVSEARVEIISTDKTEACDSLVVE